VLVAAACCPHPPALVPELAAGAAPELAPLRAACDSVLRQLVAAGPDLVVVVGSGDPPGERAPGAWGTLAPYGVPVSAGLGADRRTPAELPLSLTVGAWLLNRTSWAGPVTAYAVNGSTAPRVCAGAGEALARRARRVGVVVMGDGSASRSMAAPGYLDGRAEGFDAAVARALGDGDPYALLRLDAGLAAQLLAVGRAPWQVLAGAARGATWRSQLCYDDAPYGVGYFVALWTRPDLPP
jgi:hypothetical protein